MTWIYLDNNATTQPAPEVVAAVREALETLWANPSSVHRFGQQVRQRIELARQSVAELIGARPRDLIFTSGGTESNNLAIRGLLETGLRGGTSVLITTPVEHSAVREPAESIESGGGTVVKLRVDDQGLVDPAQLSEVLDAHAADGRVILVSVQWANNETGAIQPVEAIATAVQAARGRAREAGKRLAIYLHFDATQAVGKLPIDVATVGADLLTLAAHKFHGPKGAGALWVRTGVRLQAVQRGGPQEREKRGGTENVPGIVGMGVAAMLTREWLAKPNAAEGVLALRNRFEGRVLSTVSGTVVNSGRAPRLGNTTNLAFPGLEAEAILLGLSERGVCASAGAACSSGSLEPSPVLLAMGLPEPVAHGSVRFSLSRYTTQDEVDAAAKIVAEVVTRLGQTMPMGS